MAVSVVPRQRLLSFLTWTAIAAVCALVALLLITRSSDRELRGWSSPGAEYHLLVVEGERDWRSFPLALTRHHYLYVGREALASGYGHRVSWDLHVEMISGDATWVDYLAACNVEWSEHGVAFEEPSGHRVFIPRHAYVGGR